MDALALLCNLHADGPRTLERLREAGCGRIEALAGLERDLLAECLGDVGASSVDRFLREARDLAARLATEWGADEEPELEETTERRDPRPSAEPSHPAPEKAEKPAPSTSPKAPRAPSPEEMPAGGVVKSVDRPVIEAVLQAWRERDTQDPPAAPGPGILTPQPPRRGAEVAAQALQPGALDGMDVETCERLRRAGASTLVALVQEEALALAGRAGMGVTKVLRLQFLARRVLDQAPRARTPQPAKELRRAVEEEGPGDAAGPFA